MNDIDLTEILKNCPVGTEFYHAVYDKVWFCCIDLNLNYPIRLSLSRKIFNNTGVTSKGSLNKDYNGECLLFPSKDQRDWRKFTAPWYKKEKASLRVNDRAWLYLVSDVLTWKNGIGQYIDNPRVQELAKRLCSEYAQKLYNPSVLSNSSNTRKNEQKSTDEVEPKFHVGQYITDGYVGGQITSIEDNYHCYKILDFMGGTNTTIPFTLQDNYHLWTINDAKDGDVLCCKSGWMCIFKAINNHTNTFSSYCFMDSEKWFSNRGSECHTLDKEFIKAYHGGIHPATKEQRDTLMKAMNDAGYEWDAEKKELKKLVKVPDRFDPKTLKPFDKVLIKSDDDTTWVATLFSHIIKFHGAIIPGIDYLESVTSYCTSSFCIPYNDETKHLVGTTEEAPEFYRYWED